MRQCEGLSQKLKETASGVNFGFGKFQVEKHFRGRIQRRARSHDSRILERLIGPGTN